MDKADFFFFLFLPLLLWSIVCLESAGPAAYAAELSENYSPAVRKWEISSECGIFKSDYAKIVWRTFLELLKGSHFFVWKADLLGIKHLYFRLWCFMMSWFNEALRVVNNWSGYSKEQFVWSLGPSHSLCCYHILTSLHVKNKLIFDKSVGMTIFSLCFTIVL